MNWLRLETRSLSHACQPTRQITAPLTCIGDHKTVCAFVENEEVVWPVRFQCKHTQGEAVGLIDRLVNGKLMDGSACGQGVKRRATNRGEK